MPQLAEHAQRPFSEEPETVRITSVKTFTVGNPWKNWVFVRLETDEGKFNTDWTRDIVDRHLATDADGFLAVSDRPGIGIDLDWERLAGHPARRGNRIRLFERGWELRKSADDD